MSYFIIYIIHVIILGLQEHEMSITCENKKYIGNFPVGNPNNI
jgi:hypothetical protein